MTTFKDNMLLKQEDSDAFKDLPAIKKFICSLCGFKFSKAKYLSNHFNWCKNIKNPADRLGPGPIILQYKLSKKQCQSEELLDEQSTSQPTIDIKIEYDLDISETSVSGPSCPLSGQAIENLKTETLEELQFIKTEYTAEESMQLEHHIKVHETPAKPYKCNFTTTRTLLKIPEQIRNGKQSGKVGIEMRTGKKRFQCEFCDYVSAHHCRLARHMKSHSNEKPFKCTLCDYASAHRSGLTQHMRKHTTGKKPFKCTLCDYASAYSISNHMLTHTGVKPLKCTFCDYATAYGANLKKHMRQHTDEKPFKCTLCDYVSARSADIAQHNLWHRTEKNFKCPHCDYRSAYSFSLSRHMTIHTG